MSILNVNKINPVGGGSTITISGIASVTGSITATDITATHHGDGANLTGLPAANLTGTIADARFPATLPAVSAANLTNIPAARITGTLPAISGANLTNLAAGSLTGIVTAARLGGGTASSSTFLRGDGTFAAAGGGKVLKVQQHQYTGGISYNSTTTYSDTGLTGTFTTSASGHAGILVLVKGTLGGQANSGGDAYAHMNLVRTPSGGSATQVEQVFIGAFGGNSGGTGHPTIYANSLVHFYDTSTSASTTYTYKCQFRKQSNANVAIWNGYNGPATITFIEIGT